MVQGAGSNVGKSVLVAGLCRLCARAGLRVVPFKPQNMSNNAAVTHDGGEIGRAQALQALAAGVAPSVDMNPVLLKPQSETGAQVIVQGHRFATMRAREFGTRKAELLPRVLESFARLERAADIVVVEGAGSPAEVNLRAGDIANMGFAEAADVPVILVGEIDRGGVIASLVGTQAVLNAGDARRIKGFLINKFRGDTSLFDDGMRIIAERTGWQGLGILPFFSQADRLPAEDVLDIARAPQRRSDAKLKIVVPQIGRISNFDDLDPLRLEPTVSLEIIAPGRPLPLDADLVLLPGSKSTISDVEGMRREGWDIDIKAHHRRGGHVLGLCGGYQMLGRFIHDPGGIEGPIRSTQGLGLLDVETELAADKTVRLVRGRHLATATGVEGYEIHLGRTAGTDAKRPLLTILPAAKGDRSGVGSTDGPGGGVPDGAISADGRVSGTYVHGIFQSDAFRAAFLETLGGDAGAMAYGAVVEETLDALADHMAAHLRIDDIMAMARAR